MDSNICQNLWNCSIPFIFTLATSDGDAYIRPEPLSLMVNRFSILGSLFSTLCNHFDSYAGISPISNVLEANPNPQGLTQIWLQTLDGAALKWWYPVGPLVDTLLENTTNTLSLKGNLMTASRLATVSPPIRLVVRYSPPENIPSNLLPISNLTSMHNQFLYAMKEASSIL